MAHNHFINLESQDSLSLAQRIYQCPLKNLPLSRNLLFRPLPLRGSGLRLLKNSLKSWRRTVVDGTLLSTEEVLSLSGNNPEGVTASATHPYGVTMDATRGGFAVLKDAQGRFRTQSLFWEMRHPDYPPVFTLKKYEHEGCVSMYEKYMEIADPTEYQVAIRLLGSWDHWCKLKDRPWFQEELEGWRTELKVRLESERYYEAKEKALNGDLQATKWLATAYGETVKKPKRGRPSLAEKQAALKQSIEDERDLREDAKIIGLVK